MMFLYIIEAFLVFSLDLFRRAKVHFPFRYGRLLLFVFLQPRAVWLGKWR